MTTNNLTLSKVESASIVAFECQRRLPIRPESSPLALVARYVPMRLPKVLRRALSPSIQFADDQQMRRIAPVADEFIKNILFDEEPAFISDEATIWDVSLGPDEEELRERCLKFYGLAVLHNDFRKPLWELIEQLDQSRNQKLST